MFFIVLSGNLNINNGVFINVNQPGGLVGEMAITNNGRRTADVYVSPHGPARVVKINGDVLARLLQNKKILDAYKRLVRARLDEHQKGIRDDYQGDLDNPQIVGGRPPSQSSILSTPDTLHSGRMFFLMRFGRIVPDLGHQAFEFMALPIYEFHRFDSIVFVMVLNKFFGFSFQKFLHRTF